MAATRTALALWLAVLVADIALGAITATGAASTTQTTGTGTAGDDDLDFPPSLPDVLGLQSLAPAGGVLGNCSGQLFGFSGLDGQTSEELNFVGLFEQLPGAAANDITLNFCACSGFGGRVYLTLNPPAAPAATPLVATNDAVVLSLGAEQPPVELVWLNGHMLGGSSPLTGSAVRLWPGTSVAGAHANCTQAAVAASTTTTATHHAAVPSAPSTGSFNSSGTGVRSASAFAVLCSQANPASNTLDFVLAASNNSNEDALERALGGLLALNTSAAVAERLETFRTLAPKDFAPLANLSASRLRLFYKAVSIMRVNALAPEGLIDELWSTPDRTPHRWMWLWDSCFHSMGISELPMLPGDVAAAGDVPGFAYIKAVLDMAAPDGGIAIQRDPNSTPGPVSQTQPPLLAWAVWANYEKAAARDPAAALARLRFAYPRLDGYLRWDITNRRDKSGQSKLFFWTHGTESGMDNSQRFDFGDPSSMLAVDFSVFFAREAAFMAQIAAKLANSSGEAYWQQEAVDVERDIHRLLYNEKTGLYYDLFAGRAEEAKFSPVTAVTTFLPLWLPSMPAERVPRLLAALNDTKLFKSAAPIPSVALDTITFSTDMWRGPLWVNTNYMTALAVARHDAAAATDILERTADIVEKYYNKYGVFFEFYDAKDEEDPRTLLRKGSRTGGVRDYHWSAALMVKILLSLARGEIGE